MLFVKFEIIRCRQASAVAFKGVMDKRDEASLRYSSTLCYRVCDELRDLANCNRLTLQED